MQPKLYTPEELTAQTQRVVIDICNLITAAGYSANSASAASTGKLWGEIRIQHQGVGFLADIHRFLSADNVEGVQIGLGVLRDSVGGEDALMILSECRVFGIC